MKQRNKTRQYTQIDTRSRLNIDNSSKKGVFIFWLLLALSLIVVFITSNYTPEAFLIKENSTEFLETSHQNCSNPISFFNKMLVCKDFSTDNPILGLLIKDMSILNQFAQVSMKVISRNQSFLNIKINQTLKVQLYSLNRKQISKNQNQKIVVFQQGFKIMELINISLSSDDLSIQDIYLANGTTLKGLSLNFGYYRHFKSKDAIFIIKFQKMDADFSKQYDVIAQAILMNPSYTIFTISFRGYFSFFMIIMYCVYMKNLRKMQRFTPQQKMVRYLSIAIIFFNDPFYSIFVFFPNTASIFISSIFISIYLITLIISWVFMSEKIQADSDISFRFSSWSTKKEILYIIIGLVYFTIVFLFDYQVSYYTFIQTPLIPNVKNFTLYFLLCLVIFLVILAYIVLIYLNIFMNWQLLIWRNKVYILFNIFFVILILIFHSASWISLYEQSSQKFEIFYASMNIYVIFLQYMYRNVSSDEPKNQYENMIEVTESQPKHKSSVLEQDFEVQIADDKEIALE